MNRRVGFPLRSLAALALCAALVACAEEESGPQFANEPAPTRPPTESAAPASPMAVLATPVAATPAVATPASIADLLATRGAPSRTFVTMRDEVWSVGSDGEASRVFVASPGSRIIASDAAPGGERVAVLVATDTAAGERPDVVVVDNDGETIMRLDGAGAALATPTPNGGWPAAVAIDWSPQADRGLVSFRDGGIVEFSIGSGEARWLRSPAGEPGSIVDPKWSPTGEAVAFIATSDNGRTRALRILNVRDGSEAEVVAPPDGRFVVDFAWMPTGVALLFTEGGELGGAVTGIDLWRVNADGEDRELVVSAGTVGPVARITNVRPSPDGRSIAYSVLVPGEPDPRVNSVWIRDLQSRLGFRIQLPSIASVDDMIWTDRGLAMEVTTGGQAGRAPAQALLQVNRDGSVSALWAAPVATGTPLGGSPVATPAAD